MQTQMRVLGLDAAFANMGFATADVDMESKSVAVRRLQLVSTEASKDVKKTVRKNSDDLRRARELTRAIAEACVQESVKLVFVEVPTGAQSARAAWTLGMVVGILASIDVPIIELTPMEVKLVTGDKYAEKPQMIEWATQRYPNANWPMKAGKIVAGKAEHLADAVATIHAGVRTQEFGRLCAALSMLR